MTNRNELKVCVCLPSACKSPTQHTEKDFTRANLLNIQINTHARTHALAQTITHANGAHARSRERLLAIALNLQQVGQTCDVMSTTMFDDDVLAELATASSVCRLVFTRWEFSWLRCVWVWVRVLPPNTWPDVRLLFRIAINAVQAQRFDCVCLIHLASEHKRVYSQCIHSFVVLTSRPSIEQV